MQRIKLIDLFNIKFSEMEDHINQEIKSLEDQGYKVDEVKFLGDQLKNWAVFIVYKKD